MSDRRFGEPEPPDNSLPFLRLAFRPFFMLGALFSMLCVALWAAAFTVAVELEVYGGTLWWHMHEMLFGFVSAIVAGFLLTAVQTWTGVPGIKGGWLGALVLLWLAGRIAMFLPALLPGAVIAGLDLAFLPATMLVLGNSVVKVRQWRNIIFIPILLGMIAANAGMHWAAQQVDIPLQAQAGGIMVMLVTLLMTVMGGRVIPMFTANGTKTERVEAIPWLEKLCIAGMVLLVVISIPGLSLAPDVAAGLFFLTAALQGIRVLRWRPHVTLRTPLVWSLHLSYWCIPLGLLLQGLSLAGADITHSQAIHTLGVGGMGLMILAMISRVSLGHTGRPLIVPGVMSMAFMALFGAFLVRTFGVHVLPSYADVVIVAAGLWLLGYGCFVFVYRPVLSRPRSDGLSG
jgi:uncharacterized protein involved in response to NO